MNYDTHTIGGQGKIARIKNGLPHFATIELYACFPVKKHIISFDCQGKGWTGQGTIEEVSTTGYDDWKQGALAGINYALAKCDHPICHITITRITGLSTDTNPTIVGGAAIQAIWQIFVYEPSHKEQAAIDRLIFNSFTYPVDHIPDFHV